MSVGTKGDKGMPFFQPFWLCVCMFSVCVLQGCLFRERSYVFPGGIRNTFLAEAVKGRGTRIIQKLDRGLESIFKQDTTEPLCEIFSGGSGFLVLPLGFDTYFIAGMRNVVWTLFVCSLSQSCMLWKREKRKLAAGWMFWRFLWIAQAARHV